MCESSFEPALYYIKSYVKNASMKIFYGFPNSHKYFQFVYKLLPSHLSQVMSPVTSISQMSSVKGHFLKDIFQMSVVKSYLSNVSCYEIL